MSEDDVQIAATGKDLVGEGVRSVRGQIEDLMDEASNEIIISAYSFTGHIPSLISFLEECAGKGIRMKIIVNKFAEKDDKARNFLLDLEDNFDNVELFDFSKERRDLHIKAIVVDRKKAVVGSANFSRNGMVNNNEIGVVIEGPSAEEIAGVLEKIPAERITQ